MPGLFVAHVDANKWVVTARGFAGLFANKLLVLIDGRSVYTPLFSGVFWETQDTAFEDIDRIEVIRGPGGALWGANAVNGIINIITKDSHETTGTFIQGGGGNEQHPFLTTRYGTSLGSQLALRVFGKYFNRNDSHALTASGTQDNWHVSRLGIRIDHLRGPFVQANAYSGDVGQSFKLTTPLGPPFQSDLHSRATVKGGHILGHFEQQSEHWGLATLQAYFDRTERKEKILQGVIQTIDFDFHHQFEVSPNLETLWGLAYRRTRDRFPVHQRLPLIRRSVLPN